MAEPRWTFTRVLVLIGVIVLIIFGAASLERMIADKKAARGTSVSQPTATQDPPASHIGDRVPIPALSSYFRVWATQICILDTVHTWDGVEGVIRTGDCQMRPYSSTPSSTPYIVFFEAPSEDVLRTQVNEIEANASDKGYGVQFATGVSGNTDYYTFWTVDMNFPLKVLKPSGFAITRTDT